MTKECIRLQLKSFVSAGFKVLARLGGLLVRLIRMTLRGVGTVAKVGLLLAVTIFFGVLLLTIVVPTKRDEAYRNVDPGLPICNAAKTASPWTVLADADIENDETKAIVKRPNDTWGQKFQCAIQRHEIPASSTGGRPLSYKLAFIEFKEDGSPYELSKDEGNPYSPDELSERVRYVDRTKWRPITQLRALTNSLRETSGRNYVIVFIHGWRHDAQIGDDNVADLRRYAAHVARFLRDRCDAGEADQCDRSVTGVYVGWRGARVDEQWFRRPFVQIGNWLDGGPTWCNGQRIVGNATVKCWKDSIGAIGDGLASSVAALTLFDRKPVSETIAPHVLSALRSIESSFDSSAYRYFDKRNNPNRLIVFGHSLGGNLLATALQDEVIKKVQRHPGENGYFEPPLGNLTVLINPASEASKWTSIQRTVWQRIAFREGEAKDTEEYLKGHRFFPAYQRPVLVSVTSAFAWPPGGIRAEDCAAASNAEKKFLDAPPPAIDSSTRRRAALNELKSAIDTIDAKQGIGGLEYDTATHDLFPFFKFDFRPMADRIERYGRWLANERIATASCEQRSIPIKEWWPRVIVRAAGILRDAPFQETSMESTRTIGNLDVPRHSAGTLDDYLTSAKPFGTTHEIRGGGSVTETPLDYSRLAELITVKCPISHDWLSRARKKDPNGRGTNWDSNSLSEPLAPSSYKSGATLSARITHGFYLAGIQPVTRANDPFWNMRAYDDVIAEHGGYKLTSFICAMNQLVMDRPTRLPENIPTPVALPIQPKNPAEAPKKP